MKPKNSIKARKRLEKLKAKQRKFLEDNKNK